MADSSVNDTFMFDALKCVWEIGKAVLAVSSPPVSAGMSITEAVVTLGSGTGKNSFSKAQSDYDSYASIFSRLMKDAFDETLKKCGVGALPQRYQNRILREVLAWDDETCVGRYCVLTVSEKDGQSSKASEQLPLPDMIQLLTLNILQARSLDIRLGKLPADLDQLSREMTNTLILSLYGKLRSNPYYRTLFQNDEIIRSEDSARQQRDRMEAKQDEVKGQLDRIEVNQGEAKEQRNRMEAKQDEANERIARMEDLFITHVRELRNTVTDGSVQGRILDGQTYTIAERPDPECFKNSIRRLSDRLFINWRTGCLASSHFLARADSGCIPARADSRAMLTREESGGMLDRADSRGITEETDIGSDHFRYDLEPDELRLLSVLVQGEGAVVGWKELGTRSRAEFKYGTEDDGSQPPKGIVSKQERLTEAEYKYYRRVYEDDRRGIIICKDDYRSFLRDALGFSAEDKSAEAAKAAVKDLCKKYSVLSGIIDDKETEKGCRIRLKESDETEDLFADFDGCSSDSDKKLLEKGQEEPGYMDAWLRRYYNNMCSSFDSRITNARNSAKVGGNVFGNYYMSQVYSNAYASLAGMDDRTEAMLDFVERWHRDELSHDMQQGNRVGEKSKKSPRYGRVLVLHGQPGDGKTTFCKKAVYAHCREGWLQSGASPESFSESSSESPVLVFSLNKDDNTEKFLKNDENELLTEAVRLRDNSMKARYQGKPEELSGALVIFDGYDELSSELVNIKNADSFIKFCGKAADFARDHNCNVVVTSRTMCIADELRRHSSDFSGIRIAHFAPMTEEQQEAMVDRMQELDLDDDPEDAPGEERKIGTHDRSGKTKTREKLSEYRKVLPKLRENEKLKELLEIPSLFRMIVTCRFDGDGIEIKTEAELFKHLFDKLLSYKDRENDEETLISKYEEIASRIFCDNEDTCIYGKEDGDDNRELLYVFITKNDDNETGRLGFLHRSFYQYFLARYIVTSLSGCWRRNPILNRDMDVGKYDQNKGQCLLNSLLSSAGCNSCEDKYKPYCRFKRLFFVLSSHKITDAFMWKMITQIVELEADERRFDLEMICSMLKWLCNTENIAEMLNKMRPDVTGIAAQAAEYAIFNSISSLAAAEMGCAAGDGKDFFPRNRIAYGGHEYENICRMLRRGDYSQIYLAGLNLEGCDLSHANLRNADLRGAWLRGENTRLSGADLSGAKLAGVHMEGTDLFGANLKNTVCYEHEEGADKERFIFLDKANLREADLGNADMRKASVKEAKLERAFLEGARLDEADFHKSHLEGADLKGASMVESSLEECHLEGAVLEEADLLRAKFNEKARLDDARMRGACMEKAKLSGTKMRGADLRGVSFIEAEISQDTVFRGADLGNAILSGEQYKTIRLTEKESRFFGLRSEQPSGLKLGLQNVFENGRNITFGRYPHGSDGSIEPLKWRVLDRSFDRVLLITEELIHCHVYHDKFEDVTWEKCSLRKWLNEEFMFKAFDERERSRIVEVCNQNRDNPWWGTKGGRATWDRVFALSIEEADVYFDDLRDRRAAVTPYAHSPHEGMRGSNVSEEYKTIDGERTGKWWLRSPGILGPSAAHVYTDGVVRERGRNVGDSGVSVRPALWLNL